MESVEIEDLDGDTHSDSAGSPSACASPGTTATREPTSTAVPSVVTSAFEEESPAWDARRDPGGHGQGESEMLAPELFGDDEDEEVPPGQGEPKSPATSVADSLAAIFDGQRATAPATLEAGEHPAVKETSAELAKAFAVGAARAPVVDEKDAKFIEALKAALATRDVDVRTGLGQKYTRWLKADETNEEMMK